MEDSVGFVTAIDSTDHGLIGGLLLLNGRGRPLEFHCTAPVRPSRAHEILYGPTLRPFLIGECMTQAMLAKVKHTPQLLVTDLVDVLPADPASSIPFASLTSAAEASDETISTIDGDPDRNSAMITERVGSEPWVTPVRSAASQHCLGLEGYHLCATTEASLQVARDVLSAMTYVDWDEPFDRVREALTEAEKAIRGPGAASRGSAA